MTKRNPEWIRPPRELNGWGWQTETRLEAHDERLDNHDQHLDEMKSWRASHDTYLRLAVMAAASVFLLAIGVTVGQAGGSVADAVVTVADYVKALL